MKDEDMAATQARFRKFKVILKSMTTEEKSDPKVIKGTRVTRIARGSGVHPRDVKELLRHYNLTRKAVKGFAGNRKLRKQMMKQFGASGLDLPE